MITVPVFVDHNPSRLVGHLTIDEMQLPPTPNWCLSLGYMAKRMDYGIVTKYEVKEVSIVNDNNYMAFLNHRVDAKHE